MDKTFIFVAISSSIMELFDSIAAIRKYVWEQKRAGKKVGFVPTMGALHEGHLSLIEAARSECEVTICSIFVNPLQFNNKEDLAKYPRTLEGDTAMLRRVGTSAVFAPTVEEMYPQEPQLKMQFGDLEMVMEGAHRPGHFNGVGIVVSRLFHIVQPDKAYFGQKDFQQFAIIKRMVEDLEFPLELRCCPIKREPDGLAMSSRNVRLSEGHRPQAAGIYTALNAAKAALVQQGLAAAYGEYAQCLLLYPALEMEYFEIADTNSLRKVDSLKGLSEVVMCTAVYMDGVRLIDNMVVTLAADRL